MDISQLSQLSIGVISVLALVYVVVLFIKYLEKSHTEHRVEMQEIRESTLQERKESEAHLRSVEKEVRTSITDQLVKNTHVMERALMVLEK